MDTRYIDHFEERRASGEEDGRSTRQYWHDEDGNDACAEDWEFVADDLALEQKRKKRTRTRTRRR